MDIEVCAYSYASCLVAQQAGATRIELCAGLLESGLTPSVGLIQQACQGVSIPVYMMIRPRGGDFCYTENEIATMKLDIKIAKKIGVSGFVFGILLPNGQVDKIRMKALIKLASPLPVTFHRAFDMTHDPLEALEEIIACGCERLLTSGQKNTAFEGRELIRTLVNIAQNRIEIMAGGGINAESINALIETRVRSFHLSGISSMVSKMQYKNPHLQMNNNSFSSDEYAKYEADFEKIKAVVIQTKNIA